MPGTSARRIQPIGTVRSLNATSSCSQRYRCRSGVFPSADTWAERHSTTGFVRQEVSTLDLDFCDRLSSLTLCSEDSKQVDIDGFRVRGWHTVRESGVRAQRAILEQVGHSRTRGGKGVIWSASPFITRSGTVTFSSSAV